MSRSSHTSTTLPSAVARPLTARRGGAWHAETRDLPAETAVALVCNGGTVAVMMATPADLEDFAVGFLLSEGLARRAADITNVRVETRPLGLEVSAWLPDAAADALAARRRVQAGPTGCGLCGVDSLDAARQSPDRVAAAVAFTPEQIIEASGALREAQTLNARTHAVHAAALWTPETGIVLAREDVGRHNALDKLIGACAAAGIDTGQGVLLLSSRVSVEMVTKAARLGAGVVAAVSAPTTLAVQTAEQAGVTLVAVARGDEFEVFTHGRRVGAPQI